ncbi:hypothetical protein PC116_g23391 [Phytophthora cactorum]|nr:hypothetical protein PC116_g23391 [Phytophthora cactorum]
MTKPLYQVLTVVGVPTTTVERVSRRVMRVHERSPCVVKRRSGSERPARLALCTRFRQRIRRGARRGGDLRGIRTHVYCA